MRNTSASATTAALTGVADLRASTESLLQSLGSAPDRAMAVSVPYLRLCGIVIGGWLLAKSAAIAAERIAGQTTDSEFFSAKLRSAHFYAEQIMPMAGALARIVQSGAASVVETDAAHI